MNRELAMLRISKWLKWTTFGLALLALVGWQLNNDLLKRLLVGSNFMNPLTAVLLMLSALLVRHKQVLRQSTHLLLLVAHYTIVALAAMRLGDYFYGFQYHIDQLFYGDFFNRGTGSVNGMAPASAVLFILLSGAQLAGMYGLHKLKDIGALLVVGGCFFMMTGYAYRVPEFYSSIPLFAALQTCIIFVMLAFSVLLSRPIEGLISLAVADLEGARIGRYLMPLVVLIPFAIGYLRLMLARKTTISNELGFALVALCYALIFSVILLVTIYYLNNRDRLRRRFLERINLLNNDLNEANKQQQALNEELVASNEEIQASNEEIQASNEELSATNEKMREALETIQAQSEIIIQQKEEALLKSQQQLDIVFSNTTEGILLIDIEGKVISFNNALKDFTIKTMGRPPQTGALVWEMAHTDRQEEVRTLFELARQGQMTVQQVALPTTEGTSHYTVKYEPVRVEGKVSFVSVIARDVTERELAVQQLERSYEELKKANYELDRFVYSASHDLRAPLASILGLINLAELENDQAELKYLGMIKGRIHHLDGFIKGILDYARNARAEKKSQQINFDQMLNESMASLRLISRYEKLRIITEVDDAIPFYSDYVRLSVVFNNLLSNAIKFQDATKPESFVSIKVTTNQQQALIEVHDNGIGIEENHIQKIFDMFYRATPRTDGSGIGLYIVKETIDKLNGSVRVKSKWGEWTTFEIQLPNQMPESVASAVAKTEQAE